MKREEMEFCLKEAAGEIDRVLAGFWNDEHKKQYCESGKRYNRLWAMSMELQDIARELTRREVVFVKQAMPGTVHRASMRPQDLLPAFMEVLKECHPKAARCIEQEILFYFDVDWKSFLEANGGWLSATLSHIINERAWEAMSEIAPEGYYFGAHPGDGSDFGFWPIEEEL